LVSNDDSDELVSAGFSPSVCFVRFCVVFFFPVVNLLKIGLICVRFFRFSVSFSVLVLCLFYRTRVCYIKQEFCDFWIGMFVMGCLLRDVCYERVTAVLDWNETNENFWTYLDYFLFLDNNKMNVI